MSITFHAWGWGLRMRLYTQANPTVPITVQHKIGHTFDVVVRHKIRQIWFLDTWASRKHNKSAKFSENWPHAVSSERAYKHHMYTVANAEDTHTTPTL